MEYSFQHYLLAKQSVDDRALNKDVLNALKANLPQKPIRIIEVGAGIGTMLRRLIHWDVIHQAEYVMVDEMADNVEYASEWIPQWAMETGLRSERNGKNQLRIVDENHDIHIIFKPADIFDFIQTKPEEADLLIAHAVLDLLPMPISLPKLFSLTKSLAWFTINFDGMTILEPQIDPALDEKIEWLYHQTMDKRATGGDSRTGRHLFSYLRSSGAKVLASGASDWVVHSVDGTYLNDEAYFLHFILHFFRESLTGNPGMIPSVFSKWLAQREAQIERGELVYISHQLDFLVKLEKNLQDV